MSPAPERRTLKDMQAGTFAPVARRDAERTKPEDEPKPPPPAEVTLKRRGKEMNLPLDKAIDLAQQGWDYNEKLQALNDERRALEADKRGYQQYQALSGRLEDPITARAVGLALEDPRRFLEASQGGSSGNDESEGGEGNGGAGVDSGLREELAQLRAQIAELSPAVRETAQERARSQVEKSIAREAESYPFLRENRERTQYVTDKVLNRLSLTGDLSDLQGVFAEEVDSLKSLFEKDMQGKLDRQNDRETLRTRPPQAGVNTATPAERLGKDDLMRGSGKLLDRLTRAAADHGFPTD